MKTWWRSRTQREQWLLGAMAALLAVLLLTFGLVRPLGEGRRAAGERLAAAVAQEASQQRDLAELKALRAAAPPVKRSGPLAAVVAERATEAALVLSRSEPEPGGGLRIGLEGVAANTFFPWLAALQSRDGVVASHLTVLKSEDGGLTVDAVLVETAS